MSHTTASISNGNVIVRSILKLLRLGASQECDFEWEERRQFYDAMWGYYTNDVFFPQCDGGMREVLNNSLGGAAAADLSGIYNPVQRIVDCYENVFRGELGKEIRLAKTLMNDREVNVRILGTKDSIGPVEQIWTASKFSTKKSLLTKYGACFGTVGVRVVANSSTQKVSLQIEHPGRIKDVELDEFGVVQQVMLEYDRMEGDLGEDRQQFRIKELLTKDRFYAWREEQPWNLIDEVVDVNGSGVPNELGFVPYVLIKHSESGEDFGISAYHSSVPIINMVNALATHIQIQVHRHVKAKWFIAAGGAAPEVVDLSDLTVAYVQQTEGSARPMIEPLVAKLSLKDAVELLSFYVQELNDRQPELKAIDGKFLAQQSGDSISQLREPAEQKLLATRTVYEAGLVHAFKMAMVWGQHMGIWDIGVQVSDPLSADEAMNSQELDFAFEARPGLPITATDALNRQAMEDGHTKTLADVSQTGAEDLSRRERLRMRGYDEEKITKIINESKTEDPIPTVEQ